MVPQLWAVSELQWIPWEMELVPGLHSKQGCVTPVGMGRKIPARWLCPWCTLSRRSTELHVLPALSHLWGCSRNACCVARPVPWAQSPFDGLQRATFLVEEKVLSNTNLHGQQVGCTAGAAEGGMDVLSAATFRGRFLRYFARVEIF